MREGYKNTALGEIPVNWQIKNLSEVSKVVTGNTPSTKNKEFFGGEYPWITPSDIGAKKNISSSSRTLTELGLKNGRELPANSLLVTCIASIGKNVVLSKRGSCNQQINAIYPSAFHDTDFLYYLIENDRSRIYSLAGTTAVPIINKSTFEKIEFVFPPLPEQQKIAEILSTVDKKIDAIDQRIAETQELKKGLMQQLLTKGIGHTQFKDSPLGEIPESWEVLELGDIADIVDPQPDHRTPAEVKNGVPFVGMGDIKNGKIDFHNTRKVSQAALNKQIDGFNIYQEAFVFGKIGTIGKPTLIPIERFFALSANLILMTAAVPSIANYLYVVIQSDIINHQLRLMTNTTSQPALGIKKARKLKVPLPKEEERNHISNILKLIDDKLRVSEDKKTEYQELKKGLMQQLLTGKVRVNV